MRITDDRGRPTVPVIAGLFCAAAAAVAAGALGGLIGCLAAGLAGVLLGVLATWLIAGGPAVGAGAASVASSPRRDPITGLPEVDELQRALETKLGGGSEQSVALYVCVLQGVGEYNDAYGEACGDAMIGWLARKLRDAVADVGSVYRLRGAALAVLSAPGDDDLTGACREALLEVGEGFIVRGAIGRVLAPDQATTAAAAVELAMRRALAARSARPGEAELRPPQDPLDVLPMVRPRYEVADVAARIGRRMGLSALELDDLEAAAHLRDVGNMALPSAVLTHAGELPSHEWEFIRLHTVVGERLLAAKFGMESVAALVRSSHERWDGGGYPDGVAGTDIPLGARILFVCTAFQDMTSERAHRPARDAGDALVELALRAGSQFDPDVVAAFEEEFAPVAADVVADLGRHARHPLSVLVADDDAASRFLLARAIDAAGHQCTGVADAMSAWRAFRRLRPDVVICDARLPATGAERLCRRIRYDEGEPQTYFVTLVASSDEQGMEREPGAGADDVLAKPFDRENVHALLTAAFNAVSVRRDDR